MLRAAGQAGGPGGEQGRRRARPRPTRAALWSLGLGEPYAGLRAARPGQRRPARRGPGGAARGPAGAVRRGRGGPRRVALLGQPERGQVQPAQQARRAEPRAWSTTVAGTTRDPVDELIELGGKTWRFVDTAGIRRRVRESQGADYYASLRTAAALEKAEVAVVLVDASQPLTEQDLRIISHGRSSPAGRWCSRSTSGTWWTRSAATTSTGRSSGDLPRARWAPRVNVSARTGRHMDRLVPALEPALAGWETRVPTGRLNAFLGELVAATPPPVRGGKQPKILFATQAGVGAAALRAVRLRLPGGGLPPVHRAPAARGVRLRGQPGPGVGPAAGPSRRPA